MVDEETGASDARGGESSPADEAARRRPAKDSNGVRHQHEEQALAKGADGGGGVRVMLPELGRVL